MMHTVMVMVHSGRVWVPRLANTSDWRDLNWAPKMSMSLSLGAAAKLAMPSSWLDRTGLRTSMLSRRRSWRPVSSWAMDGPDQLCIVRCFRWTSEWTASLLMLSRTGSGCTDSVLRRHSPEKLSPSSFRIGLADRSSSFSNGVDVHRNDGTCI